MKNDTPESKESHKRLLWFASIWVMSTVAFVVTVYFLRFVINF